MDREIDEAWAAGHRNVLATLPTGGGKTFLFTGKLAAEQGYSCAIAHRRELVGQMSLTLNKRGVPHFAYAPNNVVKWIVAMHVAEHGQSFYNPNARCAVASVDTLMSRADRLAGWCQRVGLWVMDEGHHVVRGNKWGKAADLFPNARGLLVTATPERPDGKGLHREAEGLVDVMVSGPTGRELMDLGYLTDYRIFAPPSNVNLDGVTISSSTGDYSQPQMVSRVKDSQIVGDIVEHYIRIATGKLGITFVPSVEIAGTVSQAFNAAGVPAEVVSAKTPDAVRAEATRRLRRGDLKQLVNVDIFGEGFDLPAIEVISMARPTESYVLFCQQFGRALRPMEGKSCALIIDHVGNVMRLCERYGLPDAAREWDLMGRDKKSSGRDPDAIPLRMCPSCTGVFQSFQRVCPYCANEIIPTVRSGPEFVDGDLAELDATVLALLRKEIDHVDKPVSQVKEMMLNSGAQPVVAGGAAKQHRLRQEAQMRLRTAMEWWGGLQKFMERDDSESWQRFYRKYGVDVMTAQSLGRPDAERLAERIEKELGL